VRILLLATALLCASCGYQRQVVQIAPHAYAMDPLAFRVYLYQTHQAEPSAWYGTEPSPSGQMIEQTGRVEGLCTYASPTVAVIRIRARDPSHLSYHESLVWIHEQAHAEDWLRYHGDEGASPLWRLLATVPRGQEVLSHPRINARLRAEGYQAPK
jgi:hypothetical protein